MTEIQKLVKRFRDKGQMVTWNDVESLCDHALSVEEILRSLYSSYLSKEDFNATPEDIEMASKSFSIALKKAGDILSSNEDRPEGIQSPRGDRTTPLLQEENDDSD